MRILAFDPSLTGFGHAGPALHDVGVIVPPKGRDRGTDRLIYIRNRIVARIREVGTPDLVVIEGYSFGSAKSSSQAHSTGELGGVLRVQLHELGVPFVEVSPSSRMKYATGKGMAKKEAVLAEVVRRFGYMGSSNDEADAMVLLAMALDAYGLPGAIEMPKVHREGLEGVPWPKVPVGHPATGWAEPRVRYSPKSKRRKRATA